ncbi:MAG: PilZ domain-containing protein [Candidatus Omnitrophica bacterium]|nr:PilZ domain-containing protein [Candidatus Omnitrophota bacterium]
MNKNHRIQADNRRVYTRIDRPHLLKVKMFDLKDQSSVRKIEAITRNVSAGGLAFESEQFFESGTVLEIELDTPGWEKLRGVFDGEKGDALPSAVMLLAKVIRTRVIEEDLYDIAVSFVGIDDRHRHALTKYVQERENSAG